MHFLTAAKCQQGNNEANRRDVPGLFASLGQHPSVGTDARFELRLVGGRGLSGVDLPPGMEQRIIKYQGLPFLVRLLVLGILRLQVASGRGWPVQTL